MSDVSSCGNVLKKNIFYQNEEQEVSCLSKVELLSYAVLGATQEKNGKTLKDNHKKHNIGGDVLGGILTS